MIAPRPNMLEALFLNAIADRKRKEATGVPYLGYVIPAPGFTSESLARAVGRALDQGVRLSPTGQPGTYRASRPSSTAIYTVTRTSCTCRAASLGRPCKHRALVILVLSILDAPPRAP